MKLSVVISTHNRSDSLARTLKSVKELADELIVVDNQSTDDSSSVAKRFGAIVYTRPNNLMLNVNKNYGISKATGDWILYLDDDEELPEVLSQEIKTSIKAKDVAGFWIPRKNIIFGKWITHGIWWPDRQLRLFRSGAGKYPEKHVHEYIEVSGQTKKLEHAFVHYNYDSIGQYVAKMQDIYTGSEVEKFVAAGYRIDWKDAIRFPMSDFLKLYFAQQGYKDGLHGLVLSLLQAFYSFIIFVKLWEREKFREVDVPIGVVSHEIQEAGKETMYWMHTAHLTENKSPLSRFVHRLLRKLTFLS